MNPRDAGFLLLSGKLGKSDRVPLTVSQLHKLWDRAQQMAVPYTDRELSLNDLLAIGYHSTEAKHILSLLSDTELLEDYVQRGKELDCVPITLADEQLYPADLLSRLKKDCPGALWFKGDLSILDRPRLSLVGSRELQPANLAFAEEVGRQAAHQGYVLVSGNARGADRAAQESCLCSGGQVISIVADALWRKPMQRNMLYLSENGYDEPFSSDRALSRNRCIHALVEMVFVAQVRLQRGGTWGGAVRNLHAGWSPVYCYDDGSPGTKALKHLGADMVGFAHLHNLYMLSGKQTDIG